MSTKDDRPTHASGSAARTPTMRALAVVAFMGFAIGLPLSCGSPPLAGYARPPVTMSAVEGRHAWSQASHVFETRCVVCHGCYDAPCQLKLGTFEGIERGASNTKVYDNRLLPMTPTRLEVDSHDTPGWRSKGFHPVLPEGTRADPRASLLVRMLELKHLHPLPAAGEIERSFTLDLDRPQTCTDADHFESYANEHPLWGMPYALPGLDDSEEASIVSWVNGGAPYSEPPPLSQSIGADVASWEEFLNEPSLKSQVVARYIYEHLFLASLHFQGPGEQIYFRLVRSRTLTGPADEIATRRPFDDPKMSRVYYRLVRRIERPLEKTHMPYPLSATRLHRFRELFIEPHYDVERLPSYEPDVAANPFRAFEAIPAVSRYRFMLEEAEYTLMGFIKGPVCRGQVALNVIEDRFWVTFVSPDAPWMKEETAFLAKNKQDLDMPAEGVGAALLPLWLRYAHANERYLDKKNAFVKQATAGGSHPGVGLSMVWDGDGKNDNAGLTVFRHFDSATVVKGLVGDAPKTAWVIGYPLLERIHYLLVAGFDVFGNVDHQLTTRLYMDFLRMEGEANFLTLLPPARRRELVDVWYRGVNGNAKDSVVRALTGFDGGTSVEYQTHDVESELFGKLSSMLAPTLAHRFDLERVADAPLRAELVRLSKVKGNAASWLPELSFVTVTGPPGANDDFTIARDSGHTNVAHLFHEDERRIKTEDALSVTPGFLGAYPNALFVVPRSELDAFVLLVSKLDSASDYRALRTRFGVLRASEQFWSTTDRMMESHLKEMPIAAGLFDLSRLEAY